MNKIINPCPEAVREWINSRAERSEFAFSLALFLKKKGGLTDGQIGAVERIIERNRAEAAAAEARPSIDTSRLEAVFEKASARGLKKPALQIGPVKFSPAPATGANPGAIYVKEDGQYMGKVLHGRFLGRASAEFVSRILEIAGDPLGEAIKHGKLTGRCAVCFRPLSDPESVGRGIGPICAEKFFGV